MCISAPILHLISNPKPNRKLLTSATIGKENSTKFVTDILVIITLEPYLGTMKSTQFAKT
jgi:hypothetical protein